MPYSSYSHPRPAQYLLDRSRHPVLLVGKSYSPASSTQFFRRISHDKGHSSEGKHLNVVVIVTNGHDLFAGDAAEIGPSLERVALGTSLIQHVDDGEVANRVFG